MTKAKRGKGRAAARVRYAVVGLGHIAQSQVLPAFAGARRNSELVALVSDDRVKLKKLGRTYGVTGLYDYGDYPECLNASAVDAVFVALPNTLHRAYTELAAKCGVHVLCEKPMAMTEADCHSMIDACAEAGVKLMVGYRLHFEPANREAVRLVRSGALGPPRLFQSVFSTDVAPGNLRLREGEGGPLFDIGIYCLNAARSLFRAEPSAVVAQAASRADARFEAVPEMVSVLLRFPGERLATFTCSFGAASAASYQIVGTKASLRVEPAFHIGGKMVHALTRGGRTRTRTFPAADQFAAELSYFSDCIRFGREPEPSGQEGLADVRVLAAIESSIENGREIRLGAFERTRRPHIEQVRTIASRQSEAPLVHASDSSPD